MKKLAEFVKTTFLGGLVAIVPLSAIAFILWSVLSVIIEVVAAMEGVLPFAPVVNTLIVGLASLAALILLCFAAGLALRTTLGKRIRDAVDGLLERFVPLYGMAKKLTQRITGGEGKEFTPALIDLHGSSARVLGWVVEELPEERSAVYVPWTPAATFGQVYVVATERIETLDVPIAEIMGPVTEWGAGMGRMLEKGSRVSVGDD